MHVALMKKTTSPPLLRAAIENNILLWLRAMVQTNTRLRHGTGTNLSDFGPLVHGTLDEGILG